jgi:hypothetical protein
MGSGMTPYNFNVDIQRDEAAVVKRLLVVLILTLLLASCAGAATEPGSATDAAGSGWQELGGDVVIDESVIERVTPAPVEPVTMSQAEAQAALPFAFEVPAWAPPGFVLQDAVEVVQPASGLGYTSVSLTWLSAAADPLYLQVAQADDDQPALGAAGSTEVVTVNGQPATLVRTSRLGVERLALIWPRGDLSYTLTAGPDSATPDDLRRMAESVG